MRTAIILSVGDELVLGQTVDTNSAWISSQLAKIGCAVMAHTTVGDDQRAIELAIEHSIGRCDYLIISGGLGPTEDDLTRQAIAKSIRVDLEMNEIWLTQLDQFFKQRGRPMPPTNRIQAMIPRGAKMIFNHAGTAAGIDATIDSGDQKSFCRVFAVPGVPKEMKAMLDAYVQPIIAGESGGAVILSRTLHTFGMGESAIAELLGDLMKRDRNPSVGTTVSNGFVSLRLNARFDEKEIAMRELEKITGDCEAKLTDLIFGSDEQTLSGVLAEMLIAQRKTVTTAESCTGGLLAKMLTDVAGSSAYFKTGFVTYSNESKYERLGVSTEIINVYGAVSEAVVIAMAKNARRLAKANFAISISGIAGPDGGSATKPVGTVCIALASATNDDSRGSNFAESDVVARTFNFPGDREMIRDRAAKMALTMLRFKLLNKPLPF